MAQCHTYHVNLAIILHDAHTEQESKHKLVFLKQAATHVAVQAEGKVLVDVDDTLSQVIWMRANENKWKRFYKGFATS